MGKFTNGLAIGLGIGYVLGAKAGRERYEEIQRGWHKVRENPTVQRAVERGTHLAKEGAERGVHLAQEATQRATGRIRDRLGSEGAEREPALAEGNGHGT